MSKHFKIYLLRCYKFVTFHQMFKGDNLILKSATGAAAIISLILCTNSAAHKIL